MKLICCILFIIMCHIAQAFNTFSTLDSIPKKDTLAKKIPHNPKLAMKRSLMVPGWGQVYNKQIWKVPIIYAGLGITASVFSYNLKTYNDVRFAYNARVTNSTADIAKIKPYLAPLNVNQLASNRRVFRQQIDYSVLFFIAFWGLNVADAIVFGHLKDFDVSDDISGQVKLGNSKLANNNGVQLQLTLKNKKEKQLFIVK
jgi:hypothetical protein